jgi:D-alanyl-D-alanine carboxypeptidase
VSGLLEGNKSTVTDLALLTDYVLATHPKIFQFSRETNVVIGDKLIENINEFAGKRGDFLGGKTGYTDEANGNLLSLFTYQGQPILIIVLGTESKTARFYQTNILFEWISKFYN